MNARAQLSKELKELLGQSAPIEFQDAVAIDLMAEGKSRGKTNARVIADRVIEQARNGDKWAIEFIAERSEGKAAIATLNDDASRIVEESLSDVTARHLNDLAGINAAGPLGANPLARVEAGGPDAGKADPQARSAGSASPLLDLPEDGYRDPEDAE